MRRCLLAAALTCLLGAVPARAFDPGAESDNAAKSQERFASSGPASADYQAQLALQSLQAGAALGQLVASDPSRAPVSPCSTSAGPCAGDVRLYDWGGRYGEVREVHWVNRNGAVISGHLWAPLARSGATAAMPAVVIVAGDLATEQLYWYAAQALARSGYVVLTFDPQGHGRSDTYGAGADADRHVATEQTSGGADDAEQDQAAAEDTEDALDFLLSSRTAPYVPARTDGRPANAADPTPGEAKQADLAGGGQVDRADPLRGLVDAAHVGLAGHSRGADAVSIVSTRDRRVDAIVAWDYLLFGTAANAADPSKPVAPRVPALDMSGDYYEAVQPYTDDPDPQSKAEAFRAYRAAGVDAMQIAVRGGTHYEYSYVPNPGFPATLRGIDMATWYAQAWFDKYLKHDPAADRRLLTDRWRADAPGAAVDRRGDGNLLSFYYRSHVAIHLAPGSGVAAAGAGGRRHLRRRGRHHHPRRQRRHHHRARAAQGGLFTCEDLRAGCPGLVPARDDGYPGSYSYLTARTR